jgi:hypothetical protein
VDKSGFKFALEEVTDEHAKHKPLSLGHGGVASGVDVRSGGNNGSVGEDRAKVLDEEDGSPANLGTL